MLAVVPFASLYIHSVYVTAISRFFLNILISFVIVQFIAEGQSVNSDDMLTSVVLESTRQECLWEEEPRYPEYFRSTVIDPIS